MAIAAYLKGGCRMERRSLRRSTRWERATLPFGWLILHPVSEPVINITASNGAFNVTLTSRNKAITWRPVAEDGADLPELHREPRLAFREDVSVGETFDFEWTPRPGTYWFEVRRGNGEWMAQSRIVVER